MKELFLLLLTSCFVFDLKAQSPNCELKPPVITIHFGTGNVTDANTSILSNYERISGYCPRDGYYTYTAYTSDCFRGDWHTLTDDHTPLDVSGNMLLVNSSHNAGPFFIKTLNGLKSGTTYEFAVWMMNVCKITDKCPFPLLPNITVQLQTSPGKLIAQFSTGDIQRSKEPQWTRYRAFFTTPASATPCTLVMTNNNPGGCGNDFALDDITLRECVKQTTLVRTKPKTDIPIKRKPVTAKPAQEKLPSSFVRTIPNAVQVIGRQKDGQQYAIPVVKPGPKVFPPAPPVLALRTNSLVKKIETAPGEININLYDNGEIDGDTVSIYHNNTLVVAHARLSEKPVSFRLAVNADHPHHEVTMVAENLGSIPPNTSMMIITSGSNRYEVFISSSVEKNAKVILDLKK